MKRADFDRVARAVVDVGWNNTGRCGCSDYWRALTDVEATLSAAFAKAYPTEFEPVRFGYIISHGGVTPEEAPDAVVGCPCGSCA